MGCYACDSIVTEYEVGWLFCLLLDRPSVERNAVFSILFTRAGTRSNAKRTLVSSSHAACDAVAEFVVVVVAVPICTGKEGSSSIPQEEKRGIRESCICKQNIHTRV